MDFEAAWGYLRKHAPLSLETSGGTPFTVEVSDTRLEYNSQRDQTRTQTKDNFEKYFRIWLRKGCQDRSSFRNFGDERSPSTRGRYFSAVLRYLKEHMGADVEV